VGEFIEIIERHSKITKLTMALVRELTDEIHIHHAVLSFPITY